MEPYKIRLALYLIPLITIGIVVALWFTRRKIRIVQQTWEIKKGKIIKTKPAVCLYKKTAYADIDLEDGGSCNVEIPAWYHPGRIIQVYTLNGKHAYVYKWAHVILLAAMAFLGVSALAAIAIIEFMLWIMVDGNYL